MSIFKYQRLKVPGNSRQAAVSKISIVLAFVAVLSLMVSYPALARKSDSETANAVSTRVAFTEQCREPSTRGLATIFTAMGKTFVPKLFNMGLGWVERKLQEKAAGYQATKSGSTAGLFFFATQADDSNIEINPRYECIAIAYGPVQNGGSSGSSGLNYPTELGLSGTPSVYMELKLVYQFEGNTLFARLSPLRFEFNSPMSKSGKIKDIVTALTFSFLIASENKTNELASAFVLPAFTDLKPGTKLSGDSLQTVSTPWVALPTPTPYTLESVDWSQPDNVVVPVSVVATLAETDKGGGQKLFLGLVDVLQGSKTELTEIVSEAVK